MGHLTHVAIRKAKYERKVLKLSDGGGLILLVNSKGKYWRYNYRYGGKQRTFALGVYPQVSLKQARQLHLEARELKDKGVDPNLNRKQQKLVQSKNNHSFEAIAREWYAGRVKEYPSIELGLRRLENYVFPWVGKRPIDEIQATELLTVLQKIVDRGTLETAKRVRTVCNQVYAYAIATGRAERNIAADLKAILPNPIKGHFAALTEPEDIAGLLRAVEVYRGTHVVRCALLFSFYVMVRPANLAQAEWDEIDFAAKRWVIPSAKMKKKNQREKQTGKPHIVPLSRQAVTVLQSVTAISGDGRYVFPHNMNKNKHMSKGAILVALRRMGYTGQEMTAHGFRRMISTRLNESGLWNKDAIERQLAHVDKNAIRDIYNDAEYLEERTKMMQWWADYCLIDIGAQFDTILSYKIKTHIRQEVMVWR